MDTGCEVAFFSKPLPGNNAHCHLSSRERFRELESVTSARSVLYLHVRQRLETPGVLTFYSSF